MLQLQSAQFLWETIKGKNRLEISLLTSRLLQTFLVNHLSLKNKMLLFIMYPQCQAIGEVQLIPTNQIQALSRKQGPLKIPPNSICNSPSRSIKSFKCNNNSRLQPNSRVLLWKTPLTIPKLQRKEQDSSKK